MTEEKVVKRLQEQMPYLKGQFYVQRIALFGSFAKKKQKKESDVDLLVEFKKPIGLKFIELAGHLEKVLGAKIDILTQDGLKGIRIKEIARDIRRNLRYV